MIPVPDEIAVEEDDLLNPFPFFLESPVINPCLKHEQIINEILDNAGSVENQDIEILE